MMSIVTPLCVVVSGINVAVSLVKQIAGKDRNKLESELKIESRT